MTVEKTLLEVDHREEGAGREGKTIETTLV